MKKIIIALVTLISIFTSFQMPAQALLREHHQSPEVLIYHAQHSIKDKKQRAWQIVLFPETHKQSNTKYYLRLVGFPGLVDFIHPQPLEIITSKGNILIAKDVFAVENPATNVGQYDLTQILPELPTKGSLKLICPTKNTDNSSQQEQAIALSVSNSMLTEWQWLQQKYH